jgi:mono/diheme cytochrome c family protein
MRPVKRSLIVAGVLVAAVAVGGFLLLRSASNAADLRTGGAIYLAQCASCHGADLEGQPNWQTPLPDGRMPAPPHDQTGHTWHHTDADLVTIVKYGMSGLLPGYSSTMPGYAAVLTDREVELVLSFIKSNWPLREQEYQRARTRERASAQP